MKTKKEKKKFALQTLNKEQMRSIAGGAGEYILITIGGVIHKFKVN